MAVRGQMMYSSLLPSQYQKSSSLLGTYPANYPLKFIPYPMNYPQTFHPNYPMNMHPYPSMHLAQIPMQVPQIQDFPDDRQECPGTCIASYLSFTCFGKSGKKSENPNWQFTIYDGIYSQVYTTCKIGERS